MAKKTATATLDPKFLRNGKPNKAAMMREALVTLGKDSSGKDVKGWVLSNLGVQLKNSDMVALGTFRAKMGNGGGGKAAKAVGDAANGHAAKNAVPAQKVTGKSGSSRSALDMIRAAKTAIAVFDGDKAALIQCVEEL